MSAVLAASIMSPQSAAVGIDDFEYLRQRPTAGSIRVRQAVHQSQNQNQNHHKQTSSESALSSSTDNLEQLWDHEEEDESFEVPDFHFDWGVSKEKTKDGLGGSTSSGVGAQIASLSITAGGKLEAGPTPPSQQAYSNHSSASSNRVMSLTDASTASASSMVPTPPGELPPLSSRSTSARQAHVGAGLDGGEEKRVLAGRSFQRVVSAPVTRRAEEDALRADVAEHRNPLSTSTINPHRPTLTHTLSGSSVLSSSIAAGGTSSSSAALDSTSRNFVTPGLSQRTMTSAATSTGRRVGGLSRFGGPARRVIPAPDPEESEEAESHSPEVSRERQPSMDRSSSQSPSVTAASSTIRPSPPRGNLPLRSDPPPNDRDRFADPEEPHYPRAEEWQQHMLSSSSRVSPPSSSEDRYHRAIARNHNQENKAIYPDAGYHASRYPVKSASTSDAMMMDRPPPQPLRPSHSVQVRSSQSPESRDDRKFATHHAPDVIASSTSTLRPTRPAPIVNHAPEPRPVTQTAPTVLAQPPPSAEQAPPGPPQSQLAPTTKRSFLVNGAPYERLGILGKGGSSKVYSVLCPTNRVVYALKRVALDRADSETYQSYTNEIELLKRLKGHDRIIQLIDHQITFSQGNRPKMLMMVMECGEIDFAALLDEQRGRPINMNFVGLYWQQMLEAVQAVHAENVVHTDLKPANFVLVKGRLKIIDFGIAKAIANDTVNIQRDQQIGTVNYMSPEAIQRMNNQRVLKLSYPSDVWSLGCILYQMIYGSPPFQHISGGPLPKMNAIADPSHRINYPDQAVPKGAVGTDGRPIDLSHLAVSVRASAINTMKSCLAYKKEERLTIPQLLEHEFLSPSPSAASEHTLPAGSTSITQEQMAMLVNFVLQENGLPSLSKHDTTAEDLFSQLAAQNALTSGR